MTEILRRRPSFAVGLFIVAVFILGAAFAPWLSSYSPTQKNFRQSLKAPSSEHYFGTDKLGRDVFTRVLHGARISLFIGVFSVGISLLFGVLLGALGGYFGGWVDGVVSWLLDVLLAFPGILLAIAIAAVMEPGLRSALIAVGVVGIPVYARLVRSSVLSLREQEFVLAARVYGASDMRILALHILPNCVGPITVQATLGVATAILEAAGLSFLGLGAQPPTPEWGKMLSDSMKYFLRAPWAVLFPGAAILVTVLGLNLIGDALRDILDPRSN